MIPKAFHSLLHSLRIEYTSHSGKNDPLIRNHGEFAAQTLDAGHEEITARQREFFNADSDDDFAPEDDLFEASFDAEETLSESDDRGEKVFDDSESDDSEDYEEQIDEKTQDDMLADDISEINPAEDIIDVEFEDDAQDVTETSSADSIEEEQDLSLFTSRRKPTPPSKSTGSATTGKSYPVSLQKSAQTPKPSEEPSASKKKKAAKEEREERIEEAREERQEAREGVTFRADNVEDLLTKLQNYVYEHGGIRTEEELLVGSAIDFKG